MPLDTEDVYLSVESAAERVQKSTKTIRRWIASGRLRAEQQGHAYAIDPVDLEAALNAEALQLNGSLNGNSNGKTMLAELDERLAAKLPGRAQIRAALSAPVGAQAIQALIGELTQPLVAELVETRKVLMEQSKQLAETYRELGMKEAQAAAAEARAAALERELETVLEEMAERQKPRGWWPFTA